MPTLRLVYLTEQTSSGMTYHDHATNNTTVELPSIDQEQIKSVPIADATRNASSNNKKLPAGVGEEKTMKGGQSDDHEEDNDYLDTLLQEAIDEVNRRTCTSFDGHDAVRHQQFQQEIMVLSSDEESETDSSSSERAHIVDSTIQHFIHEESENSYSTPSAQVRVRVDSVHQNSGHERKRPAPIQSFDERFYKLLAFKKKYGHCYVPQSGEYVSLGHWCSVLRSSYKKIQNNQKPTRMKLSDEQIQRLNDAGFKWEPKPKRKRSAPIQSFDDRFNKLMAFKAKHGHCYFPQSGVLVSLGS